MRDPSFPAAARARRRFRAAALAALLVALRPAIALEVPGTPLGRVSDYAGAIDPAARDRIERLLAQHERDSTDQIAVAIFPSLDGEDAADFAARLFEAWKLGRRGRDNGVLVAVFLAERRVRIEVGYGLEGRLTDAASARILSEVLAPRFRSGDFAGGIEAACRAIVAATKGEFRADPRRRSRAGAWLPLAFVLLILLGFLISALRGPSRRSSRAGRGGRQIFWGGPGSGFPGGGFGGGGFSGGGGMSGGGGATGGW